MIEEVVDADDLAGVVGEAKKKEHGAGFKAGGFGLSGCVAWAGARDLAGGWVDGPVADTKLFCRGGVHGAGVCGGCWPIVSTRNGRTDGVVTRGLVALGGISEFFRVFQAGFRTSGRRLSYWCPERWRT